MDRVHGLGSWVNDIVDHSRPLILRSVAHILLKWKGIGDLIYAIDQCMDGWDGAGEVVVQWAAARLGRSGGSRHEAPFSMRFNPTDAAHKGELT
jgi:hypothetical protein